MANQYPNEKHQVGAVLSKLMTEANIDESKLAKACNISLASLSRIKNNPDSNPTISTLRPVADFFNISIDQLLGYSPIDKRNTHFKQIAVIQNNDVFSWIDNKTTKNPIQQWLVYNFDTSDNTFAINHKLNTNNNIFNDCLLIIDPKKQLAHQDITFIYNKKIGQFFIRKISIDDQDKIFLSPIEPGFSDYIALEDCSINIQIIGVVIETRLQYNI
jgi:transcriptional regulator with XRE-family HTH domain